VVHTALPASVEGYYQEIGRAGRDGHPARAVLLHGFADRKQHEWFLERSYPEVARVRALYRVLGPEPRSRDELATELRIDRDECDRLLEKLWIHGGARVEPPDRVRRGDEGWVRPYERQRRHREEEIALVGRFADGRGCRMLGLVRHFGDQRDSGRACGTCDWCAPDDALLLDLRDARAGEIDVARRVLEALRRTDGQSTGRMHRDLYDRALSRPAFERVLAAMGRAGLVVEREDSFETDGRVIEFRRAFLTEAGRATDEPLGLRVVREAHAAEGGGRARRRREASPRLPSAAPAPASAAASPEGSRLAESLRQWRLEEARRRGVPAYVVFNDRTLDAIVAARPTSPSELARVHGIGPAKIESFGERLLGLVAEARDS